MESPIIVFQQLDKSKSDITKLRSAQSELLHIYFEECLDIPRIGLKLPTGSGKSLIAILILEAWRREKKKVALLCANIGLANDMKDRCDELNIPAVTIFRGSGLTDIQQARRQMSILQYQRSNVIGIFNYHSFLFGIESERYGFPIPDILVIDDASDFETVRNEYSSIVINRYKTEHRNCYDAILNKLSEYDSIYPHISDFLNNSSEHHIVEIVFFPHKKEIFNIINNYLPQLNEDNNFLYSYRRNKEYLNSYMVLISQYDIEIRPFIFNESFTPLESIKQIIFMSATLPSNNLLHKIFGIDKTEIFMLDENKLSKEAYNSIETMGKRLIFPVTQEASYKSIDIKSLNAIIELVKIHKKVLVMVNSLREARQISNTFENEGIPYFIYRGSDDGTHFAINVTFGALVCANRYFGLDFPGESCNIGVIVKLPLIWDSMDRFHLTILNDTEYGNERLGNRLTQALGRCNRLEDDESLYYILDSKIISKLIDPSYHKYFPRNIYTEMMAGFMLCEGELEKAISFGSSKFFGIKNDEVNDIINAQKEYWEPDSDKYYQHNYKDEIIAWKLFINGSYKQSGDIFNKLASDLESNIGKYQNLNIELISAFYYYLTSNSYYNSFIIHNNQECNKLYKNALKKSIEVGKNSSWFNRLSYIYNISTDLPEEEIAINEFQIKMKEVKEQISYDYDEYINSYQDKKKNWEKEFLELLYNMKEGKHNQMLVSLEIFFTLLGYRVIRGNNQIGEPDLIVLSVHTDPKYQLGIEVKTKVTSDVERVRSLGQIYVDITKISNDRKEYQTIPIIITQKDKFEDKIQIASYKKARLITAKIFGVLIEILFQKMQKWNELNPNQKGYYRDSLISPFELYKIFNPTGDSIMRIDELEAF